MDLLAAHLARKGSWHRILAIIHYIRTDQKLPSGSECKEITSGQVK